MTPGTGVASSGAVSPGVDGSVSARISDTAFDGVGRTLGMTTSVAVGVGPGDGLGVGVQSGSSSSRLQTARTSTGYTRAYSSLSVSVLLGRKSPVMARRLKSSVSSSPALRVMPQAMASREKPDARRTPNNCARRGRPVDVAGPAFMPGRTALLLGRLLEDHLYAGDGARQPPADTASGRAAHLAGGLQGARRRLGRRLL